MPRHEATKALEIYRRAGQQAAGLSDFYEVCKGLELARNFQLPVLREPPQTFLATMERAREGGKRSKHNTCSPKAASAAMYALECHCYGGPSDIDSDTYGSLACDSRIS